MEREKMWVCEHCLWSIESREGQQATKHHYIDEEDYEELPEVKGKKPEVNKSSAPIDKPEIKD